MKLYFEFKEPYYALIAANDQKAAKEVYQDGVAEIEDECSWSLISEDDALDKFGKVMMGEVIAGKREYDGPYFGIKKEFKDIVNNQGGLLLVDGSLV